MVHTFEVGQRVTVEASAYSRAGESGVITLIVDDNAVVEFDDGEKMGYLLDEDELLPA
jgi:hypothetical protein